MKKIYFLFSALLCVGTLFSQFQEEGLVHHKLEGSLHKSYYQPRNQIQAGSRCIQNIHYSETFANPFSNGWTRTGDGSSGGTYLPVDIWSHDFNGPNGYYSSPFEMINSPSQSDGFMILDADFLNGQGSQPTMPETFQAELVSPVYDLSGISSVSISFYHMYRLCCGLGQDHLYFEVSTDGFVNVAATYILDDPFIPINAGSGTIQEFFNITDDIVGDPSNVQFRFRWGIGGSTNNNSHYYWQIDDMVLYDSYSHHALIDSLGWTPSLAAYGPYNGFQQMPSYMAATTNLAFTLSASNIGYADWTNAQINLAENGQVIAQSASTFVPSGGSAQFTVSSLMNSQIGTYLYELYGTDTATFCNADTVQTIIEITPDYYSAGGTIPTGIQAASNWNWVNYPARIGFGGKLYNTYTGSIPKYITGVRVAFEDTTTNDFAQMEAQIFINGNLIASENFVVDVNAYGTLQQVDFASPIGVSNGDVIDYLIFDNNAQVRFIDAGDVFFHRGLMVTFDGGGQMSGPYLESPIMAGIILNEGANINSIDETTIHTFDQNYPNPFDQNTVINFNLKSNEACLFEVRDVKGKLVKSMDLGIQSAGQHQIELNSNEFGEGIYFYTLYAGETSMTKKMIVLK